MTSPFANTHATGPLSTAITNTIRGGFGEESIVAVIDNRGGEVGVAVLSTRSLRITLTQFGDTPTFTKAVAHIEAQGPIEILLPNTAVKSAFARTLQASFPQCTFTPVERRWFNEVEGANVLTQIMSSREALAEVTNTERYLAVASGAALVHHVQAAQRYSFVPNTVRVRYVALTDFVNIDRSMVLTLQLLPTPASEMATQQRRGGTGKLAEAVASASRKNSLIDAIDHTTTPSGYRLLRSNVLQPPRDSGSVLLRYRCLETLLKNSVALNSIRQVLKSIRHVDIERATARFSRDIHSASKTDHIVALITSLIECRKVLVTVPELERVLRAATEGADPNDGPVADNATTVDLTLLGTNGSAAPASLLDAIADAFHRTESHATVGEIEHYLDVAVVDAVVNGSKAQKQVQVALCVKPGFSGILDALRHKYEEVLDNIFNHGNELSETHKVPSLKLTLESKRGYFITADKKHAHLLNEDVFIHQRTKGGRVTCTTSRLSDLNAAAHELFEEILSFELELLKPLVAVIRGGMDALQGLSEAIALLDILVSNASFSQRLVNGCLPVIDDHGSVMLHNLTLAGQPTHVPNDLTLASDAPLVVLTGPNASGKTTVLRQVAQAVVLAHLGCYVPARSAKVRLVDCITGVFGNSSMTANGAASAFLTEMSLTALAIKYATRRSLVLIDELGSGTSNAEGSAIAAATLEHLAAIGCCGIFATHFTDIPVRAAALPGVANYHLCVAPRGTGLLFEYKILPGPCDVDRYGITLASMLGFGDAGLIDDALAKLTQYETTASTRNSHSIPIVVEALATLRELDNTSKMRGVGPNDASATRVELRAMQEALCGELPQHSEGDGRRTPSAVATSNAA